MVISQILAAVFLTAWVTAAYFVWRGEAGLHEPARTLIAAMFGLGLTLTFAGMGALFTILIYLIAGAKL